MIENYLEYVKSMRRRAIFNSRYYLRCGRRSHDEWEKGFHEGHAQQASFEARHWRRLQKEMEWEVVPNESIEKLSWVDD